MGNNIKTHRGLLHYKNIDAFLVWLARNGYAIERPKGEYEVIRFRDSKGTMHNCYRRKRGDHLTIHGATRNVVHDFFNDKEAARQAAVAQLETSKFVNQYEVRLGGVALGRFWYANTTVYATVNDCPEFPAVAGFDIGLRDQSEVVVWIRDRYIAGIKREVKCQNTNQCHSTAAPPMAMQSATH